VSDRERQLLMLSRMGLGPVWKERQAAAIAPQTEAALAVAQDQAVKTSVPVPANPDWAELQLAVANCAACGLCQGRNRTVFGVGDRQATWLFVGEGPGRQEDLKGEPFVGPAGKLLDNMLASLGLGRDADAYIANVVKCRPADDDGSDRPPSPEEIAACLPFLRQQIETIQPDVIVALGRIAAVALLGLPADTPVGSLRGKLHQFQGKPLVVTYHPAYLLRQPADKAKVWRDLCMARAAHASQAGQE
jgi:uracil-DNA glycosylase family 4